MHVRRIALWTSGGLLLLLVAAFSWLWLGDLGVFKPQLERFVTEKTGREFAIEGRFEVDVGLETVIIAEGIRFENADWSGSPQMLEVGSLELRIDTFSLVRSPLTIDLIEFDNAKIHLERPPGGAANWVIAPPAAAAETKVSDDSEGVLDVIIRQIDAHDVRIVYDSAERTGPLDLTIATLSQQHRDDDFLELAVDARLADRAISIRAVAGTWEALLSEKNVAYELDVQLDAFRVSSKGTIDDLVDPHRPSLSFAASGPDINRLLRLLNVDEGGSGDIDLSGSLQPSDGGPMVIDVEGRLGQTNIDATGSLMDLQSLDEFDVTMRASSPNLSRVLALFGITRVQDAPFTLDLNASRRGPTLEVERADLEIAGTEFHLTARLPALPGLDDGEVRLEITGSDFARLRELLRLPGAAEGPFSLGLEFASDDQGEEILHIALTSTLANIEASGRIADAIDYVGSELDFSLSSDSVARVGQAYGLTNLPDLGATVSGSITVEEDAVRVRGPAMVNIDGTRLQIEGLIAMAPGLKGSRLSLGVEAPGLAKLVGMFAPSDQVPPLPIDLTGEVLLQGDRVRFINVDGGLGQSSVQVDGTLRLRERLAGSFFNVIASGPALEELVAHVPNIDVYPGAYSLSGGLGFNADAIHFKDVELSRARGEVNADVTMGLAREKPHFDFDVSGRGASLHAALTSLGDFEINDAPFSVAARGNLRNGRMTIARLNVGIGNATLEARGDLDLELAGRSTAFQFDLDVPSLGDLGLFKQRRFRDQRLAVTAEVRGNNREVRIDDFIVRLGDGDLQGSFLVQRDEIPRVSLVLHSDLIRVAPLFLDAAPDYEKTPEFDDGRLIPDIRVPFEAMKKLDGSVVLDIKELQRDKQVVSDIEMAAELKDGAFYLHNFGFEAQGGTLQARAALEPADGAGSAALSIRARDLTLAQIGVGVGPSSRTNIDINVEATGTDLRALAGNSNGVMFLNGGGFIVPKNAFLTRLYGDMLNEILETINPFTKTETETRISCIVLPIEINDGRLGVNPEALLQTDKIRIVSNAAINLKSEKMEMTFRTTPRKGLTISAGEILNPFVMVVGTLAAPRLAVDAKGTLISGGAAVATGGLSILARATWERLVRSKNPCETAAENGLAVLEDRFADFPDEVSPAD